MSRAQKAPIVWYSNIFKDSTLVKGFDFDTLEKDSECAVDAIRRNNLGEPLSQARFPKEFWYEYPDKKIRKIPEIATPGGVWVVSKELMAVLERFNLGQTAFYPTKLFEHDRKTPIVGTHYCINFGETKNCFLPEHSPDIPKAYPSVDYFITRGYIDHGMISFSSEALDGCDLWIEENLRGAIFLSDQLVTALKKEKLSRRFGLRKCNIIHQ